MQTIVTRQELLTALLFVSTDESRYVLNGVCLSSPGKSKQPILVSTDGRRLCVIETTAVQEGESDAGEIVLRGDFIRAIAALSKSIGGKLFPWIRFEANPGSDRLHVAIVGGDCYIESEKGALIETAYPKWRGVIPPKNAKREPCREIGLNAEYVADYAKAAKTLECETPIVQMSLVGKESAIEVNLVGHLSFYGLVMQTKLQEGTEYQPEFLGIMKQVPKPEPEPESEKKPEEQTEVEGSGKYAGK